MSTFRLCINSTVGNILIIISIGVIVYSNIFNSPMLYDDLAYLRENPAIKDLGYFYDFSMMKDIELAKIVANNFNNRFVGYFTFALNYKIHGLDVTGYHVINLFIHIVTGLLVYFMLLWTLKTPFFESTLKKEHSNILYRDNVIALFSSLLFVSHPVQTQAVTYITQRFTSLATMFYLLSIVIYIKWRIDKQPDNKSLIFSLLSAVLAMKTKEISFTLPIVITIYEFMFFKEDIKKRLRYLTPILLTIPIIPLSVFGARNISIELDNIGKTGNNIPTEYLYTQFRVIVTYMRLIFIPANQSIEYDYQIYKTFLDPNIYLSFLLHLLLLSTAVYLWYFSGKNEADFKNKWLRIISFGILWFFVTLSVESSVIPLLDVIYEHRLYLPSIGFFMAIMGVLIIIQDKHELLKKTAVPLLTLVIIVLSVIAYTRNLVWQDDFKLWSNALKNNPNKRRVLFSLGLNYAQKGLIGEASQFFLTSSKKHPEFIPQHFYLGSFFEKHNRLNDAAEEYLTILNFDHNNVDAHLNLGRIYEKQKRFADAIGELRAVLKLNPSFSILHVRIAELYKQSGQTNKAIQEYKTVLKNNNYAVAHNNLAELYKEQGHINDAIKEYKACLKINPEYPQVQKKLKLLLVKNKPQIF